MASCHKRWLSLHRDREWVIPNFCMKVIAVMLSMWSCTTSPGLANSNNVYQSALSFSQLMCFPASCSDQVCWKGIPQSVLAPPAYKLASVQIWSLGLGECSGLVLLAHKTSGSPPLQVSHYIRVRNPDTLLTISTLFQRNIECSLECLIMEGTLPDH